MKSIKEIEKLSVEELERIGADENIPVPGDLSVKIPSRKAPVIAWSAAAAAVVVVAGFITSLKLNGVSSFVSYQCLKV